MVSQHSPENDRAFTDILDNFIIETFEPQQMQVNNRLVTLEGMVDDIENKLGLSWAKLKSATN